METAIDIPTGVSGRKSEDENSNPNPNPNPWSYVNPNPNSEWRSEHLFCNDKLVSDVKETTDGEVLRMHSNGGSLETCLKFGSARTVLVTSYR